MKILDMFSGVGGFSLGFHAANFRQYDFGKFPHEQETESDGFYETVAFCEIDEKCRKVLQKRFPGVPVLSDVRHVNRFTTPQADIICGGFPCQDLSIQGTKQGFDGERSSLFYEMLRAAKEVNAKHIVFENSAQLIRQKKYFTVFARELWNHGFWFIAFILCAADFGYFHERQRAFIIAYPIAHRWNIEHEEVFNETTAIEVLHVQQQELQSLLAVYHNMEATGKQWYLDNERCMPDIRNIDGFSEGLDRIAMIGNALVPAAACFVAKFLRKVIENGKRYE